MVFGNGVICRTESMAFWTDWSMRSFPLGWVMRAEAISPFFWMVICTLQLKAELAVGRD